MRAPLRSAAALAAALAAAACGKRVPDGVDPTRAAALFDRVPVDTANGLSSIAIDGDGAVWTDAERAATAYEIVLDETGTRVTSTTAVPVDGVPPDTDLEAIAWLGPARFAFGAEGHAHGEAVVLLAVLEGGRLHVTRHIELPEAMLGLRVEDNDGVEGLCGTGDVVYVAVESNARDERGRWAPIVRLDLAGGAPEVTRLGLTSEKGKLSALDCTVDADGTAHLTAIERHFDVTHVVRADVPRGAERVDAKVVLDLGPVLHGSLNLEGLGVLPGGRVVMVVDNQYDHISGPNELVVFKPGAVP